MIRSSFTVAGLIASMVCFPWAAAATTTRAADEERQERLIIKIEIIRTYHGKRAADDERQEGLIGLAELNGEATQIAYHYPHGEVFPPELIRSKFHDGETQRPSVQIDLVGYVDVPAETRVDIYHAAGGVNRDNGTLYLDGRLIGQVGDDTVKVVIYSLTLPKGTHEVRWELTGGTFQPNILKFQNVETGELLPMFHTARQSEETGAAKARTLIEAKGKVAGWPPAEGEWTRVATDKE